MRLTPNQSTEFQIKLTIYKKFKVKLHERNLLISSVTSGGLLHKPSNNVKGCLLGKGSLSYQSNRNEGKVKTNYCLDRERLHSLMFNVYLY